MSSRLRSLNSTKISFFAFQDIITSVSGILILVTLILATELDRPASRNRQDADPELEAKLAEILQQAETDARNQQLQNLLTAAETAPAAEKLEADILRLRTQLAEEKSKSTAVAAQLAANQAAITARDQALGLTTLKAQIKSILEEAAKLAGEEARVRADMDRMEQRVAGVESRLLKLRAREGQLWLLPDKSSTTKEPILATIGGAGAKVERFDRPDQSQAFDSATAASDFEAYLATAKPLNQYIVFLVRPSGIELFDRLVKLAREKGFEVGFDALEENRQIHFTTPPALDDEAVPPPAATGAKPQSSAESPGPVITTNSLPATAPTNSPTPAPATTPPPPAPKPKSWWQRFLEFIGLA